MRPYMRALAVALFAAPTASAQTVIDYVQPRELPDGGRISENVSRGEFSFPARVEALVPKDHGGVTTTPRPVLVWYLSQDTSFVLEFVLDILGGSPEPLVKKRLDSPLPAGLHTIDLADLGVEIERNKTYEWSVSLIRDPADRKHDARCGGHIVLREAPGRLTSRLLESPGGLARARTYASNGVWYEAFASLMEQLRANPDSGDVRKDLAILLEDVGLEEVAAYARSHQVPSLSWNWMPSSWMPLPLTASERQAAQ